ncbi:2-hydroxyacyl-CoA dehydratase subunit D [Gordonia sp. NPDC003376]
MSQPSNAMAVLTEVARDPESYVVEWKRRTQGKVVGALPMNFPAEIAHAGGALPVIIQENRDPDSLGRNLLAEFYCGFTRNIADQAAKGRLGIYDGFFLADHCIQLMGAMDVVRDECDDQPIHFAQLATSLGDPWTTDVVTGKLRAFVDQMSTFTGSVITAEMLATSIALFNENRRLLRAIFEARESGGAHFTSLEMQVLVKSSMVMDKTEHTELLRQIIHELGSTPRDHRVRLHLSGHFCHAPNPDLLRAIEECDVVVVNDDLYHGARFISTDVSETLDPIDALAAWYLARDVNMPCPTRVKHTGDWEDTLVDAVESSNAQGVLVLMAKFCEPHMLYYPQLRRCLTERGIPHLLIETEHEGVPMESIRTRVEALVERIRRSQLVRS